MTPGELAARKYRRHVKTKRRAVRQRTILCGILLAVAATIALCAACGTAAAKHDADEPALTTLSVTSTEPWPVTRPDTSLEPVVTKPPVGKVEEGKKEEEEGEQAEIEPDLGIHYVSTDAIKYRDDIVTQGVFLEYELQYILQSCCNSYEVPYPLMLAIAEVESHFDPDAVSSAGDQGLMQINPINNEWLTELGMDPTTYHGNIEAAVYIMAGYLDKYGDIEKALMAYNNGPTGARRLWDAGTYSTAYTRKVMAALEYWTNLLEE